MTNSIRLGALCWVLTVEFFVTQLIAMAAWPAYGIAHNDISLLGATACGIKNPAPHGIQYVCSPLNPVFNIGVVVVGLLIVAGVWLTRRAWPPTPIATLGLVLLGLGGVGGFLVGLFPFNVHPAIHSLGAGTNFIIGNAGVVIMGFALWRHHRTLAIYAILTGVICIASTLLYGAGSELFGRGILERLASYPQTVWFMVMGALILNGKIFNAG